MLTNETISKRNEMHFGTMTCGMPAPPSRRTQIATEICKLMSNDNYCIDCVNDSYSMNDSFSPFLPKIQFQSYSTPLQQSK